jgi:GR25 family glycosyltransferase involved in LPS biosynthesis
MNVDWHRPPLDRVVEGVAGHARHATRHLSSPRTTSIGRDGWIGRIHVINLDREARRWDRMSRELSRIRTPEGRLLEVTRRFSAVDARQCSEEDLDAHPDVIRTYTLADQLFVHPDPLLAARHDLGSRRIRMTRQEVAVALSHVQVWRRVAEQDVQRALVLEDDVFFARGFGLGLDRVATQLDDEVSDFDVLYLSYKQAPGEGVRRGARGRVFDPVTGLWQLSGYVLTRRGARCLLDSLPVVGPVDLWINHRFADLTVHAVRRPLIRQRSGVASSNLYSVLPVLAELGSITRERPLMVRSGRRPVPVIVHGEAGSGHGAAAEALSMLGYRCCQDIANPPAAMLEAVMDGSTAFDAYVNVRGLGPDTWTSVQRARPATKFVLTVPGAAPVVDEGVAAVVAELRQQDPSSVLVLSAGHPDPWQQMVNLAGVHYPAHQYPRVPDRPPRSLTFGDNGAALVARWWRSDRSPWILPRGIGSALAFADLACVEPAGAARAQAAQSGDAGAASAGWVAGAETLRPAGDLLYVGDFVRRDDTFPGNLALFTPVRVCPAAGALVLHLAEDPSPVRRYASGAIASTRRYLYGRFSAELRASSSRGTVTGMFLHRSSPRQEIDIEILGRDPTRMLTNVYFNPGCEGDRFEYGYRGTPAVVDLGFDASAGAHLYEIEWRRDVIRWIVDGRVLHVRHVWDPTPVPHRPMEFDVNLWAPRSKELAGRLRDLPATVEILGLRVDADPAPQRSEGWAAHALEG